MSLRFDDTHTPQFPADWLSSRLPALLEAQAQLEAGSGVGGDLTAWVNLPDRMDYTAHARLKAVAAQIRAQSDVLLVVGIGGSYLGAHAILDLLHSPQHNLLHRPQIFFVGTTLAPHAWAELRQLLKGKDVSVNVISKSGSTLESAASFALLYAYLQERYDENALRERIFITTDPEKGALRAMAQKEGFATFDVPPNIGGRYSVLTAVGLLPLAVAGIDIDALLFGAGKMRRQLQIPSEHNPALRYAAARHACLGLGKQVELLVSHEPHFHSFGEWWKQLFAESEGKEGKGLFPATAEFCADLHSMGQYIQEGTPLLFETVVTFQDTTDDISISPPALGFPPILQGRSLHALTGQIFHSTLFAHVDGGIPNLLLQLGERSAETVGELVYFFEYACAISAYLLGVNPFNQEGVEAYKRNMLALLGEKGLEEEQAKLLSRIHDFAQETEGL